VVEVLNKISGDFNREDLDLLQIFANLAASAAHNAQQHETVVRENRGLRETLRATPGTVMGTSAAMRKVMELVGRVASSHATVLLLGETGTGKEVTARQIHQLSPRREKHFIAINCAALPETLLESELFGHEKGAFTGADKQHIGLFEQAGDGTLFLDEIGDLSASAQIRLLRVIQEKKFRRLNGKEELPFKARLVCATHHNLPEEVRHKKFRLDLYQRINEATIHAPPLRERKGDIEVLARYFLRVNGGERQAAFADETLKILCGYPFPGNVRELENIVKSALRACVGEIILPQSLPMRIMNDLLREPPVTTSGKATEAPNLDHIEELMDELARSLPADWLTTAHREAVRSYIKAFNRVYLRKILKRHKHNLKAAAKASRLDPKTFRKYWKEAGLPPLGGDDGKPD
jgi:transcriptional regulator with GAF, ATPase, and Fis domain